MSLNITSEITTRDGFVLPTSYGRVAVYDSPNGINLNSEVNIYKDEAAFEAGDKPVKVKLVRSNQEPYDRDVDGVDILDLAHDRIMDTLSAQGVRSEKNL